jgi:hypothetical protein
MTNLTYIAIRPCGCTVAAMLCNGNRTEDTQRFRDEMHDDGCRLELVTTEGFKSSDGLQVCQCGEKDAATQ